MPPIPQPVSQVISTLTSLESQKLNRQTLVKKSTYLFPITNTPLSTQGKGSLAGGEEDVKKNVEIVSYSFPEAAFKANPPVLPVHARGFFVRKVNNASKDPVPADAKNKNAEKKEKAGKLGGLETGLGRLKLTEADERGGTIKKEVKNKQDQVDWEVVVRGYDKFFNLNETPETVIANLESNTKGPYEVTVKENGCIIFISALENTLIVTSKHALNAPIANPNTAQTNGGRIGFSKHAAKGEEWITKHFKEHGKNLEDLVSELQTHKITAIFELADDDFEEHILEYPPGSRGLYLHGITHNTPEFNSWTHEQVVAFAKKFDLRTVEGLEFDDLKGVMDFAEECKKTGHYGGRAVEGFVVRCESTVKKGQVQMFKIKFDEPYLMFREWREVTSALLAGRTPFKPRYPLTEAYVSWASQKIHTHPSLFTEFPVKGVIRARNMFLVENNIEIKNWEGLIADAKTQTEMHKKELEEEMERQFEDDSPALTPTNSKLHLHNSNSTTLPSTLQPPLSPTKNLSEPLILLPISIVGMGKSTLGRVLAALFPNRITHIQSDDSKKRTGFLAQIPTRLKKFQIVYADKCNHLKIHREDIKGLIEGGTLGGKKPRVVAVEWDWGGRLKREVGEVAVKRIEERGENHQKLTPGKVPTYESVVWQFLTSFEPLNPSHHPDASLFSAVIKIPMDSSISDRVKTVLESIGLPIPDDTELESVIQSVLSSDVSGGTVKNSNKSPQTTSTSSPQPTPKKKTPIVRYYGLSIPDEVKMLLKQRIYTPKSGPSAPLQSIWETLESNKSFMVPRWHVTLALGPQLPAIAPQTREFYESHFSNLHQQNLEEDKEYEIEMNEVVWNERILCVPLWRFPEGLPCMNKAPHVTLGILKEGVKQAESNELLEQVANECGYDWMGAWKDGEVEKRGGGGAWVRWRLEEGVKVRCKLKEFYH
ncbi:hypothetical protein HDV05_002910 [Chytridiales sp. JEL 0842]|nr:hypothetical protein HDV05_002910 [Chytridiales sp. JEL 0842]